MPESSRERMRRLLGYLYGDLHGDRAYARLAARIDRFGSRAQRPGRPAGELFDERDVVLITYGDLLRKPGEEPLRTLLDFLLAHLSEVVNTVHILPFYPYSSDDGFSVIDYTSVDPDLGGWEHIRQFKRHGLRLMFDAVINHVSARSDWFRGFLAGDETYRETFLTADPSTDLSMVTRPRALPLLTPFETASGTRHVWTTFSADQIDLNYGNPDTLLDVVDVLLEYIERGADVIRLDAIAYLWKEIGTNCIHRPQTHAVVQLIRAVVDDVAPHVMLLTETNVPHEENVSYFGNGTNEAHMVYQFALPPLTAHAILAGSAVHLSEWAAGLGLPSDRTTFFNFTASHDGLGVRPAEGILSREGLNLLLDQTMASGGAISSKANPDGSGSPYELNVTYFDLLNWRPSPESRSIQVRRFLVSQAIMLALAGIPGIYLHSVLGSRNYAAGPKRTGHPRAINREKLMVDEVKAALADPGSLRHAVFHGYRSLLEARARERAFHPCGAQRALCLGDRVFGLLRHSPDGGESIVALHNLSASHERVELDLDELGVRSAGACGDILSGWQVDPGSGNRFVAELEPYQVLWLKAGYGT